MRYAVGNKRNFKWKEYFDDIDDAYSYARIMTHETGIKHTVETLKKMKVFGLSTPIYENDTEKLKLISDKANEWLLSQSLFAFNRINVPFDHRQEIIVETSLETEQFYTGVKPVIKTSVWSHGKAYLLDEKWEILK